MKAKKAPSPTVFTVDDVRFTRTTELVNVALKHLREAKDMAGTIHDPRLRRKALSLIDELEVL